MRGVGADVRVDLLEGDVMKKKIPAHIIECCDCCERGDQYLTRCDVCGEKYCLTCQGVVCGSYGFTRLCRKCAELDEVTAICRKFAKLLTPIFVNRDEALKSLLATKPKSKRKGATP